MPLWRCGVLLLLVGFIYFAYWLYPPVYVPGRAGVVMSLPNQVGNLHGLNAAMKKPETEGLPPDTGFARKEYFNTSGDSILCTIVLSGAGQNSIHRPEACLPGQGWSLAGQEDVPIQLASGHTLIVRNLSLERDELTPEHSHHTLRRYYMYWFVGDHVTTPSHFTRILVGSWDRVVHNRAHRWAFVIATSTIPDGADGPAFAPTKQMLTDFIRQIVPSIQKSEMPPGTLDPAAP